MTCRHGCWRCERSRDIQTLIWVFILLIIASAAIQYWYVSVPILGAVIAVYFGYNKGTLKPVDRS